MKEIAQKISEIFEANRFAVMATIILQAGPSPRGIGAKCLIMEDGSLVGTIGGGALEADTLLAAKKIFETGMPERLHFSLTGRDVEDTDMLCGGKVDVFLEPVAPDSALHVSIFQKVARILGRGGSGIMATVLDQDRWQAGRVPKMFLDRSGEKTGSLFAEDAIDEALSDRLEEILQGNTPVIIPLVDDEGNRAEIFVEPVVSSPVLYVFGGGHVSRQIVPVAALVGFQVVVTDDRPEFADTGYFPNAHEVLQLPFKGVMDRLSVDDGSYLVIVTRGHMHDKEVLAQALKTDAKYIGMIGSKRKRNLIYEKLLQEGFTREDISRVHSPVGIDIGAETPEEIAVSIVAELIQVRAGHV
jgi:xanthine dehydrogenase accessory factor